MKDGRNTVRDNSPPLRLKAMESNAQSQMVPSNAAEKETLETAYFSQI